MYLRLSTMHERKDRIVQVSLGNIFRMFPVIVHPPFVLQHSLTIEHETVWRAERTVHACRFLRLIETIGAWEPFLLIAHFHLFESIFRVLRCIVAVDEDELHTLLIELSGKFDDTILVRLRVRAVVASKNYHEHGIFDFPGIDEHAIRGRK